MNLTELFFIGTCTVFVRFHGFALYLQRLRHVLHCMTSGPTKTRLWAPAIVLPSSHADMFRKYGLATTLLRASSSSQEMRRCRLVRKHHHTESWLISKGIKGEMRVSRCAAYNGTLPAFSSLTRYAFMS